MENLPGSQLPDCAVWLLEEGIMITVDHQTPVAEMMRVIRLKVLWRAQMTRNGWQPAPNGGLQKQVGKWQVYIPSFTVQWYAEQGIYPDGL